MRRVVATTAAVAAALAGGCQSLDVISVTTTTPTVTGGAPLATETDAVTFVAVVTETNGDDDDLAGGVLTDTAGLTYAALASAATGGPYTATLTFAQINQVAPISFAAPGGERTFVATFYDDDSDVVTTDVTLDLACRTGDGVLGGACAGACTDLSIDSVNCGACGHSCEPGAACVAGACSE